MYIKEIPSNQQGVNITTTEDISAVEAVAKNP